MKQRLLYQDAPKGLLDGLVKTELCLKNSVLDAKLFELIRYRVSQINGCAYCLDAHHKTAIALGGIRVAATFADNLAGLSLFR